MGITNFNQGVSSFGAPVFPGPQPGGYAKTLFVGAGSVGYNNSLDGLNYDKPLASLGGAAGAIRDGAVDNADRGTLIVVRKGHTDNISAADFFSLTGARKRIYILGEGDETERPTLTWTVAGSTWLWDTDSIALDNFNLNLEPGAGTINVALPITVTGAGCIMRRLKIRAGTDANNKVTVGILWNGVDGRIEDVVLRGATAATATTFLRLTAADRLTIRKLRIYAATTAAGVGSIQFLTTASAGIDFEDIRVANNLAASTAAVSGMAACTGFVSNGHLHVTNNNATDLTSAWGTKASVQFDKVGVTNDVGEVTTSLLPLSA